MQFPPVKQIALENNIEVQQPTSIRTEQLVDVLSKEEADFFIVIAYGKILPQSILEIPKKGCINIHASLLPRWRGAAPIQFSILNGDAKTGVTSMLMDEGLDTGDILLKIDTHIGAHENLESLSGRLASLSADCILKTLDQFEEIVPVKQESDAVTHSRLINKDDLWIDWNQDANRVVRQFLAFSPKPGVQTLFRKKRLKIIETLPALKGENKQNSSPGTVVKLDGEKLLIKCKTGSVAVTHCQPENRSSMSVSDFINGYQVKEGEILG